MNAWSWFWCAWFGISFTSFLAVETWALVIGQPENTLSWQLWRLMNVTPNQPVWQWSATHILVGGLLALTLGWLILHLDLGIWR
ncbi:MAG TPA: hypothetical protein VGH54_29990 [Mycobacterium sp.]|uniref:hypothetical protein n=1 Tax=Mycobacterium sp. TaxID=1785 RepID=UPI002F3E7ACE